VVVVTQSNIVGQITFICGNLPDGPSLKPIFAPECLSFLNAVSIEIRRDKTLDQFVDLKTFGFWCRSANLIKISKEYKHRHKAMGRGIALHIAPSNVALNFAYSMAFGLLSGNQNIVRLPSQNFVQVQKLVQILKTVLSASAYINIRPNICLIQYARSDEISKFLSGLAQVRLIWGGDTTISQFKTYQTTPRCVDMAFSDRYSITICSAKAINELEPTDLNKVVRRFFNDSYLMDQHGCSSPQALVWVGTGYHEAKKRFWTALEECAIENYDYDLSIASDKFAALTQMAALSEIEYTVVYEDLRLVRLQLDRAAQEIEELDCKFGMFSELAVNSLDEIIPMISGKMQTISFFGIQPESLRKMIINNGLSGVDRIVPIGRSFDIGPIWDGYDVIQVLSRIIAD
jgi:hypothetical protein